MGTIRPSFPTSFCHPIISSLCQTADKFSGMQSQNTRRFSREKMNSRRTSRDQRDMPSLANTMKKFSRAVDSMDETILIPTRLLGLNEGQAQSPGEIVDLYSVYAMLKSVKAE